MPGAFDREKERGAFARMNEVPVDRGFLAPLATYADGKTELALPGFPLGMIWDGLRSFGAKGFDTPEANELNVKAATDAAGGAMTGSFAAGLAGGMADDAVRASVDDFANYATRAETSRALMEGANAAPKAGADGVFYRGVTQADTPMSDAQQWWASSSPKVAADYTVSGGATAPAVIPSRFNFKNALTVDGRGATFDDIPFEGGLLSSDDLANLARTRGYDGLMLQNVLDDAYGSTPSNVGAALRPGTVFSATTGDLLYSNAPTGAAIPAGMETGEDQPTTEQVLKMLQGAP